MEVLLGIIGILLEQIFPPIEGHGEGEWISERRIGGDGMQQEKNLREKMTHTVNRALLNFMEMGETVEGEREVDKVN